MCHLLAQDWLLEKVLGGPDACAPGRPRGGEETPCGSAGSPGSPAACPPAPPREHGTPSPPSLLAAPELMLGFARLCLLEWQRDFVLYASNRFHPSVTHASHGYLLKASECEEVVSAFAHSSVGFFTLNLTLKALAPILKSIQEDSTRHSRSLSRCCVVGPERG